MAKPEIPRARISVDVRLYLDLDAEAMTAVVRRRGLDTVTVSGWVELIAAVEEFRSACTAGPSGGEPARGAQQP